MPISPYQIRQLLTQKHDSLTGFDEATFRLLQKYKASWKQFSALTLAEQMDRLPEVAANAGGRPLEAGGCNAVGLLPFYGSPQGPEKPWANREESLNWAREILDHVTTFAVDGSQIFPSKDVSLPIALVQVGWFENAHQPAGAYEKDIRLEMLTPEDLKSSDRSLPEERRINIRRFEMEIERLVEYINTCNDPERCLVFFDGALVVTFAEAFEKDGREPYVRAMLQLLRASETRRVPLVGYVDTSYARDLTTLLQQVFGLPPSEHIHDAQLLNPGMAWGDRTPLYRCDRGGILNHYQEMADQAAFTYLKTNRDGYPARLEMPLWVWEDGHLETLLNRVRAEVAVGGGYPYAIETADQTAVLHNSDRQIFYRILQDWAEKEKVNLRFSRKMVSKVRRR